MAENDTKVTVEATTEDLDSFDDLFNGRAEEKVEEQEVDDSEAEINEAEEENAEDADDNSAEDEDVDSGANEDDDSETEGDDDEDEDADPDPKPKGKKKSFQDRIDELTAARREAERDAAKWQALAEERERTSQSKEKETDEPEPETTRPDASDKKKYPLGDLDPAYQADMLDFKLEERIAELETQRQKAEQEKALEARSTALQQEWGSKVEEANETYDDFQEAVQSLETAFEGVDLERGQLIAETVMRMEKGADVLYHLAKNPDAVSSLISGDPVNAALALGRIEAGYLNNSEPEKKKVVKKSKAPLPPKSLNKGNKASLSVKPDTDDLDAFEDVFFDKK